MWTKGLMGGERGKDKDGADESREGRGRGGGGGEDLRKKGREG